MSPAAFVFVGRFIQRSTQIVHSFCHLLSPAFTLDAAAMAI